ncbi:MAG TPA: hypothetical protein VFE65_04110 [Pseudonocardia sp.]|jgi:hypothetical protein|nr:hypothetical protein [Pseudonocardia sp.]
MDDTIDDDPESAGPSESGTYRSGAQRQYRPGRGGYDPEAAALAASARYAFRQRMVLLLVLFAVISGVLAAALRMIEVWYLHGAVDLGLIGYLVHLRREVRLEQAIRARRAARGAGSRRSAGGERLLDRTGSWSTDDAASEHEQRPRTVAEAVAARETARHGGPQSPKPDDSDDFDDDDFDDDDSDEEDSGRAGADFDDQVPALPRLPATPMPQPVPGTVRLELDDEDPELHDLADRHQRGYRRAAGQ